MAAAYPVSRGAAGVTVMCAPCLYPYRTATQQNTIPRHDAPIVHPNPKNNAVITVTRTCPTRTWSACSEIASTGTEARGLVAVAMILLHAELEFATPDGDLNRTFRRPRVNPEHRMGVRRAFPGLELERPDEVHRVPGGIRDLRSHQSPLASSQRRASRATCLLPPMWCSSSHRLRTCANTQSGSAGVPSVVTTCTCACSSSAITFSCKIRRQCPPGFYTGSGFGRALFVLMLPCGPASGLAPQSSISLISAVCAVITFS